MVMDSSGAVAVQNDGGGADQPGAWFRKECLRAGSIEFELSVEIMHYAFDKSHRQLVTIDEQGLVMEYMRTHNSWRRTRNVLMTDLHHVTTMACGQGCLAIVDREKGIFMFGGSCIWDEHHEMERAHHYKNVVRCEWYHTGQKLMIQDADGPEWYFQRYSHGWPFGKKKQFKWLLTGKS